jgi:hypothetical protein
LIAAEQTGRVAVGLEIDPRYVDIIVRRWQSLTGLGGVLEGDHRSFEEIAAVRRVTPAMDSSASGGEEGAHAAATV